MPRRFMYPAEPPLLKKQYINLEIVLVCTRIFHHTTSIMTPQEATLNEIFPHIHPSTIQQVLASKNNNVREAHELLLAMSDTKKDASSISSSSSSSSSSAHFSRKAYHEQPRREGSSSSSENWRSTVCCVRAKLTIYSIVMRLHHHK